MICKIGVGAESCSIRVHPVQVYIYYATYKYKQCRYYPNSNLKKMQIYQTSNLEITQGQ